MSILPTTAQGSTSYSSVQSPSPNPNPPIHGNPHHHRHFNHRRGNPPLPPRSIQSPPSIPRPGELASAGDDSCEPTKKVAEFVSPDGQTSFSHRNGDSQSPSPPGSGGFGSARSRGKISPTGSSPQSLHSTGNSLGGGPPSSGRRAQMMNANHLLNFHYDPIIRSQPRAPPPPSRRQRKIKAYNRDLFLQANYKFVVLDTGSYTIESMDPDKMLTWEDIICVRYSTPFPVQCPICLEHPLCSQITSCGHIFCFPCILQYLLMGKEDLKGDHFKRCPLCFEMVSPKDLYTIYIENVKQYHVGDTVEFMLLTRQKDSFTPSQKHMHETNAIPNCNDDIYDPFSKFKLTSDVELSVRKAMSDLDGWLARADSGLVDDIEKLPYVCAAMEHLEQRKKYWNEQRAFNNDISSKHTDCEKGSQEPPTNANSTTVQDETCRSRHALPTNNVLDENNWQDNDTADGLGASEGLDAKLLSSYGEDKGFQRLSNGTLDLKDHDSYNFYQAADGQHLILHPLNVKCLLHHYGSYDKLPHRLCGKILQLETVTQSEAIRRRYRYLSHFSLTTTFQLCEIDMSSMLPPDALLPFMDEIKRREKLRKQLAKKEWKEKMKAEAMAAYSIPNINSFGQSFYNESPQFSMDDFEALGSSTGNSSSPPVVGERLLFSNVARLGFAAGHDSPSLKIEETSSHKAREGDDSSSATGSRNSEPPSFANVISKAKSVQALDTPKTNETGKKGKKPNRVLLSTASGRRY